MPKGHSPWNQRFGQTPLDRLRNRSIRDPKTGCLLWQGSKNADGYGHMLFKGKIERVHVIAWRLFKGPVPKGKIVCHTCDAPACWEQSHLYAGTNKTNSDDKLKRGRLNRRDGEHNGRAKLTLKQATTIRNSKQSGPRLAARYNVDRSTINRVKRGAFF